MDFVSSNSSISPFLWFDNNAEEAANFYVSVFKNSRITNITRYSSAGFEVHGRPAGSVMTVGFELEGVKKYIREQEQADKEGRF